MTLNIILPSENSLEKMIKQAQYLLRTKQAKTSLSAISQSLKEKVLKSKYILWNYTFYNFLFGQLVQSEVTEISSEIKKITHREFHELITDLSKKYKTVKIHRNGNIDNINLLTIIKGINKKLPIGEKFWFIYEPCVNWEKTKKGKLILIKKGKNIFWDALDREIPKNKKELKEVQLSFNF